MEADLLEVVKWADLQSKSWAFTLSNAGAVYAEFRHEPSQLGEVDWEAVAAEDFRSPQIKEGKQAEFLVREFFPWHLTRYIGVINESIKAQVLEILKHVNSNQKVDHCGNEKVDHPKVVKSGCFLHFLSQFIVTFPETVRFPLKNQNVGMMGQPIQKSRRQGGISKDL